jgi:predicted HTH domain antitoxin
MAEVKSKIREAVTDFPLFRGYEEKERFFLVLGLLLSRQISFARAAELAGLSREELSFLLDKLSIEYNFLTEEDIKSERESVERLLEELGE